MIIANTKSDSALIAENVVNILSQVMPIFIPFGKNNGNSKNKQYNTNDFPNTM